MSHQDYSSKNENPDLKDVRFIYVNIMFLIYKSYCGDCIFCKLFPLSECKVQLFSNSYDPTVPSWISDLFSFLHEVWHTSVTAIEASLVFKTYCFGAEYRPYFVGDIAGVLD